jgi:hypothetical protein
MLAFGQGFCRVSILNLKIIYQKFRLKVKTHGYVRRFMMYGPQIVDGVGWSIKSGVEVWFWKDNWFEIFGLLLQHALCDIPKSEGNMMVVDMVLNNIQ